MSYSVIKTKEELLVEAAKSVPFLYRLLNFSVSINHLEERLQGRSEWEEWKRTRRHGDRIWPFCINRDTLAMRRGFIIMRDKSPYRVILTEVS
jgi:hypothetical protein